MDNSRRLFLFCVAVLFITISVSSSDAIAEQALIQKNFSLFSDEAKVVSQIEKEKTPSTILLWQLGSIRLKHAAELYKGWKLNKKAKDFQKALIYAESSTKLGPDNDEAWLLLGMLYSEMKAEPEAMGNAADALVHAVDINPANGRAQLLLAQVLMEQGRYWSAIEQFKMLIEESEAMRTPALLSQLTFCYIADGRVQAGLDYILKAPEMTKGDSNAKLRWRNWKMINQAVLMRAKGDKDAGNFLKVMFFYHDPSLTVIDEYQKFARHLLKLWGEDGQNE
jgi:lipopolysaccharide biosynthesis regulator YciM